MGASMGHQTKLQNLKMEYMEEGKGCHTKMKPKSRGNINSATQYYKTTTIALELQKCHSRPKILA